MQQTSMQPALLHCVDHFWLDRFSIFALTHMVADLTSAVKRGEVPSGFEYAVNLQIAALVDYIESHYGRDIAERYLAEVPAYLDVINAAREAVK